MLFPYHTPETDTFLDSCLLSSTFLYLCLFFGSSLSLLCLFLVFDSLLHPASSPDRTCVYASSKDQWRYADASRWEHLYPDTDSLFEDGVVDGIDSGTDNDLVSSVAEEDSDDDDDLFDAELRHPLEHYRADAANLNVKRLRWQRYGLKTQGQLDRLKEHISMRNIYLIDWKS